MLFDSMQANAMRASLDALQIKQKVLAHNVSNYETPGYKARNVQFEELLGGVVGGQEGQGKYSFRAHITTQTDTTVRPDGNNVDVEKDSLALFDTYLQSTYLYQKIGGQFTNLRYVLNQQMR